MTVVISPDDLELIAQVDSVESEHPSLETLLAHEQGLRGAVTAPDAITADCRAGFHAIHSSGKRPLTVIDLICVHATQGGTSRSVASYFTTPQSGGSATLVVDDNSCYRCLADNEIPWGAPGANYHGF